MKRHFLNTTYSPIVVLVFILLGACDEENFLDRYPKAEPSPAVFFVNEESARMAVNACYTPWQWGHSHMHLRDMTILLDALTDDSFGTPNRSDEVVFDRWNLTPTQGHVVNWWRFPYQSINAANYAIDNIPFSTDPNFSPAKQAEYIAEAKFLRAYTYLFLTTFYGDIPLLTNAASDFEQFNTARSPRSEVMAQVVEDFAYAKDNLPTKQQVQGPPNKAAAAAFLAKTYLFLEEWEQAETAAREALQLAETAGHKLQDNYLSIWTEEGNPELLFYWSYVENVEGYGENFTVQRLCRNLPATLKVSIYGDGWGTCNPQRSLFDAFEENDPRRDYTLIYPGSDFDVYPGPNDFPYTHESYNEEGEIITWDVVYKPGDMVKYDHRWGVNGLNTRKMLRPMHGLTRVYDSGQDIPVMRLAELYLILAEALAEQGNSEALTWINKVRARPSVNMALRTLADGNLVDLVRHERRVELALEGLRIFDLIRWGTLADVFGDGKKVKRHFFSDYLPESSSYKYDNPIGNLTLDALFPIPQYEMDNNSEINTNNPGW